MFLFELFGDGNYLVSYRDVTMVAVKLAKTGSIVGERRHGHARHPTRFEERKGKSRIDEKSRDYRNNRSLLGEHNECCFMNDAWPFFSHRVLPSLLRSAAATVEFLAKIRSPFLFGQWI